MTDRPEPLSQLDYGEYLRRVSDQRQRDEDRFSGRDSHPGEPAYSSATGKPVHVPMVHIELDAEGLPCRLGLRGDREQRRALRRVLSWLDADVDAGFRGQALIESVRQGELAFRAMKAEEQGARDAYEAGRPFRCEVYRHCGGYKTQRGLDMHKSRSHGSRDDSIPALVVAVPHPNPGGQLR